MAFRFEREKTVATPYILIDEEKGYIRFEGESFHENVVDAFREVSDWLSEYLKTDFESLIFDCKLLYFNSSTAKFLLNMLLEMDEHSVGGNMVTVNWICSSDNDIIIECGEDFSEELDNLQFKLVIE